MNQIDTIMSYFEEGDSDSTTQYYNLKEGYHAEYSGVETAVIGKAKEDDQLIVCAVGVTEHDVTESQLIRRLEIFKTEKVY